MVRPLGAHKEIVYYPGCFVEHWDPEVGSAAVRVLERNGFRVHLAKALCCGIPRLGYGDVRRAVQQAEKLTNSLLPLVEKGYDVVTACPSCSLSIKEYPRLLTCPEATVLAERTFFLSHYLYRLHEEGEFNTDLKSSPYVVAYHSPCHLKAQGLANASTQLLGLVPGLAVIDLDRGCCGMAGTKGARRDYYESSLQIGRALFDRIPELKADVVATDCGACKLQIEHAARSRVTHPIIILDRAYNCTPPTEF